MNKNVNIKKWLVLHKKNNFFLVKKKKLSDLKNWNIKENKIYHSSKKFFQIVGFRITSNYYYNKNWDQPLIIQNEKGILGILRRKYKGSHQYLQYKSCLHICFSTAEFLSQFAGVSQLVPWSKRPVRPP